MTTALVIEAFLALPHGLPARLHHGRRDRGDHFIIERSRNFLTVSAIPLGVWTPGKMLYLERASENDFCLAIALGY